LYFTIVGRSVVNSNSSDDQSQNTFYTWNCDKKDIFRRGLIGKLPTFNKMVNDVNTDNNITLNTYTYCIVVINQFSETSPFQITGRVQIVGA